MLEECEDYFFQPRVHLERLLCEEEYCGIHFWRGGEGAALHFPDYLYVEEELGGDAQAAVIACAGFRYHPLSELLLDHEDCPLEFSLGDVEQDGRGNVIGNVSDEDVCIGLGFQEVAFNQFYSFSELFPEELGPAGVLLHNRELFGVFCEELFRKPSVPAPDFYYGLAFHPCGLCGS